MKSSTIEFNYPDIFLASPLDARKQGTKPTTPYPYIIYV